MCRVTSGIDRLHSMKYRCPGIFDPLNPTNPESDDRYTQCSISPGTKKTTGLLGPSSYTTPSSPRHSHTISCHTSTNVAKTETTTKQHAKHPYARLHQLLAGEQACPHRMMVLVRCGGFIVEGLVEAPSERREGGGWRHWHEVWVKTEEQD